MVMVSISMISAIIFFIINNNNKYVTNDITFHYFFQKHDKQHSDIVSMVNMKMLFAAD